LSLLAESLPPVEPPPRVKARFLETIGSESRKRPARPPLGAKRAHEGKWRPGDAPGITYKVLYFDKVSGLVTTLVRMEAGAFYPGHRHSKLEQCLVLEGDLIHDNHVYGPGDFTWAEAGTIDPGLHTKTGNLLLIVGAPETEKVPV
jgi:anti-sigma factor ChrR (cupin superfamily)